MYFIYIYYVCTHLDENFVRAKYIIKRVNALGATVKWERG